MTHKAHDYPAGDSTLTRIAMFSARHRRLVALSWVLLVVLAVAASIAAPANTDIEQSPPGESGDAADLYEERFGVTEEPQEIVVFEHPTLTVDDPAYQDTVSNLMARLRSLRAVTQQSVSSLPVTESKRIVTGTTTHYDTGLPPEASPFGARLESGGNVTFALVALNGDLAEAEEHVEDVIDAVAAAESESQGFQISVGGDASITKQSDKMIEEDLAFALQANIVVTLVILVLAFGALIAAAVPLSLAFAAIIVATGILSLISQLSPLSQVYSEIVLLMGLATGIDYALFVVSRYRSERSHGASDHQALVTAMSTSGKAVVFAGTTVLLAVSGMFLVNDAIFTSLGLAAIVVVALAIVSSVTLLPALLAMLGDNVNRLRIPFLGRTGGGTGGFWGWASDRVLARPAVLASVTVIVLLAMASPVLFFNLGFNGSTSLSDDIEAKRALASLKDNFTLGLTSPAIVLVDAGKDRNVFAQDIQSDVREFESLVASETVAGGNREAPFGSPIQKEINDAGDTEAIRVPINADTGEQRAIDAVNHIRDDLVPQAFAGSDTNVLVGGASAANIDFRDNIIFRTPIVFTFVLGLAFIILLLTFRSLVIAAKAIVLNLLSVGAAYGLLVLVFQEGYLLEPVFRFEATGIIESWLPLFLFSILFGLSMDYHMFIMGRIKEAHEHGYSNDEAISIGVKATAGTITNAAAIMCAVAIIFAFTRNIALQQFGFGLAAAIFIDATVIRSILLPASMKLLGERNWFLPRWLEWMPKIQMAE
jgi:RND superfamily putative drug exporter